MEVGDQTERHDASTDTIIEELKTLAKYMLEATEAARQRTLSVEGYKSYEALLGALESSAPGTNCIKESTVPQYHCDPVNEISFSGGDELRKKTHNLPLLLNFAEKSKKGTMRLKQDIYNGELDNEESSPSEKYEDDVGYSAEDIPRLNQNKIPSNTRLANFDCSGDSEENIYDGVKTQVIFKAVDPTLYQEISGCTWLPEPLCIRLDTGETIEDDSEEETADIDDEEDDTKCKKKRVFRVPSFPFGGGVTEGQAQLLSKMFIDAMRRGGLSNSIGPKYITKKEFINYEYEECFTTEKSRDSFVPKSPFEFVVELEREVVFDAVQAREERRREFRRLAGEGRAPVTMGSFNLRVIMDPLKTGFEEEKTFPIERGTIIADRYQIIELLGKATFSRAVRCYDLHQPFYEDDDDDDENGPETECIPNDDDEENKFTDGKKRQRVAGYAEVCLKIINNSKDFFDQSLDEIRLLTLINKYKDPDKVHVIRLIDCFYYKEHTMLVTELLSDNLYEYSKYNREEEETFYFTIPRLRRIARQIVEALTYVHSLNLIHADLKPENVLFVSHRRCVVKVIDFGSSCFLSDHLSSYIQSRSYRAPEVIFGCDYDGRIDVWSLGAILAELVTGEVLFTSETVPEMLARIVYVCGQPFPRRMLWEGRHTAKFINKFGCIYEQGNKDGEDSAEDSSYYYLYTPVFQPRESQSVYEQDIEKKRDDIADLGDTRGSLLNEGPYSVLRQKLAAHNVTDETFISFVEACLTLDHKKRPRSKDLLSHPFLTQSD